jgi:hypothetical protein
MLLSLFRVAHSEICKRVICLLEDIRGVSEYSLKNQPIPPQPYSSGNYYHKVQVLLDRPSGLAVLKHVV